MQRQSAHRHPDSHPTCQVCPELAGTPSRRDTTLPEHCSLRLHPGSGELCTHLAGVQDVWTSSGRRWLDGRRVGANVGEHLNGRTCAQVGQPLIDHYRRNDLDTYLDACTCNPAMAVGLRSGARGTMRIDLGPRNLVSNSLSDSQIRRCPAPLTWFSGGHVTRSSAYTKSALSRVRRQPLSASWLSIELASTWGRHTIAHRVERYRGCGRCCLGMCWKTRMAPGWALGWLDAPRSRQRGTRRSGVAVAGMWQPLSIRPRPEGCPARDRRVWRPGTSRYRDTS